MMQAGVWVESGHGTTYDGGARWLHTHIGHTVSTNYLRTFITVSPDSKAVSGIVPSKAGGIASLQHALLLEQPYAFTSDELLFEVHIRRNGIAKTDRDHERALFFARSHACLRASPLVKQFGWGLHHDEVGKIAAYGVNTDAYRELVTRPDLKIVSGMRSRRG
jgi:Family of unknown function (DUF6157)